MKTELHQDRIYPTFQNSLKNAKDEEMDQGPGLTKLEISRTKMISATQFLIIPSNLHFKKKRRTCSKCYKLCNIII